MQYQSDGVLCDFYATANAITLALDGDPTVTHYDEYKMSEHFIEIMQNQIFRPFPGGRGGALQAGPPINVATTSKLSGNKRMVSRPPKINPVHNLPNEDGIQLEDLLAAIPSVMDDAYGLSICSDDSLSESVITTSSSAASAKRGSGRSPKRVYTKKNPTANLFKSNIVPTPPTIVNKYLEDVLATVPSVFDDSYGLSMCSDDGVIEPVPKTPSTASSVKRGRGRPPKRTNARCERPKNNPSPMETESILTCSVDVESVSDSTVMPPPPTKTTKDVTSEPPAKRERGRPRKRGTSDDAAPPKLPEMPWALGSYEEENVVLHDYGTAPLTCNFRRVMRFSSEKSCRKVPERRPHLTNAVTLEQLKLTT